MKTRASLPLFSFISVSISMQNSYVNMIHQKIKKMGEGRQLVGEKREDHEDP